MFPNTGRWTSALLDQPVIVVKIPDAMMNRATAIPKPMTYWWGWKRRGESLAASVEVSAWVLMTPPTLLAGTAAAHLRSVGSPRTARLSAEVLPIELADAAGQGCKDLRREGRHLLEHATEVALIDHQEFAIGLADRSCGAWPMIEE